MKNKHVKSFNGLNENKNLNISDVSDSDFNNNTEPKIIFSIREDFKKKINELTNRNLYYITKEDFENIISILSKY